MNDEITVINYLGDRMGNGGIESFVANMSEGMKKCKINYIVVANYRGRSIYESRINNNKGKVIYLFNEKVNYIRKLIGFVRFIKEYKHAVIYFHASNPGLFFYCYLVKLNHNAKIIYHVHSTKNLMESGIKQIRRILIGYLFSNIPKINVACSKNAGIQLYGNKPFTIVHNGIDLERFRFDYKKRQNIRNRYGLDNKFVMLQVGRLSFEKNQKFSLQMLQLISKKRKNISLVLVGDGNDKKILEQYTVANKIEDSVDFILPKKNIEEFYSAADVLLFPSIFEGLGIVAIEAQAAGLPVICSENIVDEVIITKSIVKVELSDKDKWIDEIDYIYNSDYNRTELSETGIKCCENAGFSINNSRNELIKLYKKCLD